MSNKTYDVLKNIALVWIPAIASLYFGLASIWGLPYAEQIVGTLSILDTFLGAILGISNKSYVEQQKEIDKAIEEYNKVRNTNGK